MKDVEGFSDGTELPLAINQRTCGFGDDCKHCQTKAVELDAHQLIVELRKLTESEAGFRRSAQLAQSIWVGKSSEG